MDVQPDWVRWRQLAVACFFRRAARSPSRPGVLERLQAFPQPLPEGALRATLRGADVLAADLVPILCRLRSSSRQKDIDRWDLAGHLLSDQQ